MTDKHSMDSDKKRLMMSVLHFLRSEFRSGLLSSENQEGLEVAIQCLESVYDIQETVETEPSLIDIYKTYLVLSVVQKTEATDDERKEAEALKLQGNNAMNESQYYKAVEYYTRAIQLDPKNAVYYCNRAAAHSKLQNHNAAIVDCKVAVELDPIYGKAYGRLGLAYCGLEEYERALDYYQKAIELEPTNDGYIKNYELAVEKINTQKRDQPSSSSGASVRQENPFQELNSMLGSPQLLNIATQMLADPSVQNMMSNIISDGFSQTRDSGMEQLLNVGQRLAQQMNTENPQFVEELRAALTRSGQDFNDSTIGSDIPHVHSQHTSSDATTNTSFTPVVNTANDSTVDNVDDDIQEDETPGDN